MTQPWAPLLDVTEESMSQLVKACVPDSPLYRVTQRIIASLGCGPEGVISAFQSAVDGDDPNLLAGFSSAV